MPLAGQLNRSVAGLGSPELIGVDHICNKDIHVSISDLAFLHDSFDNLYACLCLPFALMVV